MVSLQELPSEAADDNVSSECSVLCSEISHCNLTDEFSAFGNYVAAELRKISDPLTLAVAKHKINDVLFQAALGVTGMPTTDKLDEFPF